MDGEAVNSTIRMNILEYRRISDEFIVEFEFNLKSSGNFTKNIKIV